MKSIFFCTLLCIGSLTIQACSLLQGTSSSSSSNSSSISTIDTNINVNNDAITLPEPPTTPGNRPSDEVLSGGQWIIASVANMQLEAEDDAPYINFDPASGRFYASNGCNIFNGDYALRSDGVLTFGNVLSTMNYCPDDDYGHLIAALINDNSRLTADYKNEENDTYIFLRNKQGKVEMILRRHNMEFLNGNWRVAAINGKKINSDECTIFFDIAELKVHGNTGCNYFNGEIYIDPMRSNAIDLSKMVITRMSCPNTSRETAMMVALEQTTTAKKGKNDNTVVLYDDNDNELLTLKRIQR